MARLDRRLPHNAPGAFYVDSTCIDCDTCRWVAPATFTQHGEQSVVHAQPATAEDRRRALQALVACPTSSIGTETPEKFDAASLFPEPIAEDVHHCGYHAESSFGAASYLIVRPEGNVLVDSPRFAGPLVKRLEALGGVKTLFLTHRDDVADHAKFRAHFGCERVLHEADVDTGTADVERKLVGNDPVELAPGLVAIPTPGHTEGSACLLWRDRFLFSGDHVAWSARRGHVYAFRQECWFDWDVQIEAMGRLLAHRFSWILPGHGRRCSFPEAEMRAQVERCIAWMRTVR